MTTAYDRTSTSTDLHGLKRYSITRHITSDQATMVRLSTQDLLDGVIATLVRDMERKHDRFIHKTQVEWVVSSDTRSHDLIIRAWVDLKGMTVAERDIASRIWHAGRKAGARSYTEPPFSQPFFISPWE